MISYTDRAWAAGIVDGEGCIAVRLQKGKYYNLVVTVTQGGFQTPAMLLKLQSLYGGSISKTMRKRKRGRPVRRWIVATLTAHSFLKSIRRYLVQKADQADLALKFREHVNGIGQRHHGRSKAMQAAIYRQLKACK